MTEQVPSKELAYRDALARIRQICRSNPKDFVAAATAAGKTYDIANEALDAGGDLFVTAPDYSELRLAAERVRDRACAYNAPADSLLVKRELIGELARALGGSITERPTHEPCPAQVWICSNPQCRAAFDSDPQGHCPVCKQENGSGWSTICTNVRTITRVQLCRPADRAMFATEAGQELLKAVQEHISTAPPPAVDDAQRSALVYVLRDLKAGIAEHATDVVWYSAIQTACDRIEEIVAALPAPSAARYCPFNHKPCEPIDLEAGLADEATSTKPGEQA